MGCGGVYSSGNASIAASPYTQATGYRYPCGTQLELTGPGGTHTVTIQDACPGCGAYGILLDLSEAAIAAVCGRVGNCNVTARVLGP